MTTRAGQLWNRGPKTKHARRSSTKQLVKRRSRRSVRLEVLESRRLLDAGGLFFVDQDATGAGDGSSWIDAYPDLPSALTAAAATPGPDEIRIAEGVYRPTDTTDRSIGFDLPDGVSLLGGYAGDPNAPDLRDVDAFHTALSGDIGIADDVSDNSFHVVNVTRANVSLDGLTIRDGNANGGFPNDARGGGLNILSGSVNLTHSRVVENSASFVGGGIFAIGGSVVSIGHTTFSNNQASSIGGGLTIDRSELSLVGVSIDNNQAGSGGGLFVFQSTTSIVDSTFTENLADGSGGAIRLQGGSLAMNDSSLVDNAAGSAGGGMWSFSGASVEIQDATIVGNEANFGGGILFERSVATVEQTLFEQNTGRIDGGALFNFAGQLEADSITVRGNEAFDDGAGILSRGGGASTLVTNSTIESNRSSDGAGIFVDGGTYFSISDSTIAGNQGSFGAGILNNFGTSDLANVNLIDNTANQNAGALLNFRGTVTITESLLRGNRALGLNPQDFAFTVGRGGAIENVGLNLGSSLTVTDTVIKDNFAATQGGAIDNNGSASMLTLIGTTLIQNEAGMNGGAIFNAGAVTATEVHFAHNIAGEAGGAIFNNDGSVVVVASLFSGNKVNAKPRLGTSIYSTAPAFLSIDAETTISKNKIAVVIEEV